MTYRDLVKQAATVNGTGAFTLGAAAVGGYQTMGAGRAVGELVDYAFRLGSEWEVGVGTIGTNNVLTRAPSASSNGGALVNFAAGTGEILETVAAASLNSMRRERAGEVPFASALPLDFKGDTFLAPHTMSSPLTLTVGAGAVRNAWLYARIISDGTNVPALPGGELNGSAGYDNRAGIMNMLQGWFDGYEFLYTWSQKANAVPLDTTGPTMNGSLSSSAVTTGGFTLTWIAGSDNVAVTGYERSIDGGSTWANVGNVLTVAIAGLTAATPYPTRVRGYDAAGNRSLVPLSLTVTTAATADITDPTMSGSLMVDNVTSSGYRMLWPAGADNVAVTGYETSIDGGTTYSDAGNVLNRTIAGATAATLYNLRVRAYDAAGRKSAPLSATVTTSAASAFIRFTDLSETTESGAGPYTYTGTGGDFANPIGGIATQHLQAGIDGSLEVTFGGGADAMLAINTSATKAGYSGLAYYIWIFAGAYSVKSGGTDGTNMAQAAGDLGRWRRAGSTLYFEVSKDNRATWVTRVTYTGCPTGILYFQALPAKVSVMSNPVGTGLAA